MDLSLSGFMQPTTNTRRQVASNRDFANAIPIVMTAKTGSPATLDRRDGFAEKKFDGTRTVVIKRSSGIRMFNGRGQRTERTHYPEILQEASRLNCRTCILDGELVFFNSRGKVVFLNSSATRQTSRERGLKFKYMVFDIIERDGNDLRSLPIEERKRHLNEVVGNNLSIIKQSIMVFNNKREFLRKELEAGNEGVMFKRSGSRYSSSSTKSSDWLKVKRHDTVDVIAKGMTAGEGERLPYFGALKCYLPDGRGGFKYIGKVGGGFTNQDLQEVLPLARSGRPFIIEVKIMEWSPEGKMRMPSFVRLRPDKTFDEIERR